jgi:hypothetical protein
MTAPPDALDTRPMRHNTSVKRELLVNAPLWTEGLTFDTYPGIIPPDFHDVWTKGWSAVLWGRRVPGRQVSPCARSGHSLAAALALCSSGTCGRDLAISRPSRRGR